MTENKSSLEIELPNFSAQFRLNVARFQSMIKAVYYLEIVLPEIAFDVLADIDSNCDKVIRDLKRFESLMEKDNENERL